MAKRVAILGASSDRTKYSNKSVRAYLQKGWEVIPVNPKGGDIEGLPVAKSLRDIKGPVDLISVYLPPTVGMTVLGDIASLKARELMFNPGADSPELIEAAQKLGLVPIVACSIIAVGTTPAAVGE